MASLPPQPGGQKQGRRVWIKRASIALPLLCLVIFGAVIGVRLTNNAQNASAESFAPIKGQVPALVTKSTLVGPTSTSQSLSITVGLQLRNAENLKNYIDSMTRHKSLTAHHHLSSSQIAAGYAPLASSQQSVIDYLQGFGFKVTTTGKLHLTIGFQGTVADAENAFHLQINNYRSPKGQTFYAPASDPSVPTTLAGVIQSIAGLDDATHFSHPPISKPKAAKTNALKANVTCATSGSGYFIPSQIATAYNLNSFYSHGYQGEGQTVALVELDNYNASDISNYKSCFGGSSVPINNVTVDGGPGSPGAGAIEVELDMELILSAAPHLAALNVYEAPNDTWGHYLDLWSKIISDDTASVISTSWGGCEAGASAANLAAENNLFLIAAAQGQSIFAASGDSGTNDCGTGAASVDDPASQPYVTGVGGTALTLNSDNTYNAETTWNDQYGASGGGISSAWRMPSWQAGSGVNNSYTSSTPCAASSGTGNCREVPDVSLNADPNTGYAIYCSVTASCGSSTSKWLIVGGTSAAAPLWAAFMALTNQKTLHDGGFNIGFVNPLLYQIDQNASGTSYANDFNDVTTGNNDGLGDGQNAYPATTGYDLATGLGSFNAWNLASDLETLANSKNGSRGAPANTTWYFAEGEVGGSYKEYLTVLNPSTTDATITVEYFFSNKAPVTITHTAPANLRSTINVNNDLGVSSTGTLLAHSTLVTSSIPVVVERPMYFNAHGAASGTDVQGATSTGSSFYFAAGDSSTGSYEVLAILNPNTTAANVTVAYLSGGKAVESDTVTVGAQARGTTSPTYKGHTAIQITSDQPIVVERTEYFSGSVTNAGGQTTGASSTMGVTTQGTDWLFAEGYTGHDFQENLVLANFGANATTATIKLEYTNGTVQTVQQQVSAQSQVIFDVNNANSHPNCSASTTPSCTVSNSVSIEVTSADPIVAERVQYFHFGLNGSMYPGMDDVVGQQGPASQTTYSFAEGSCGTNFLDWLTLQNPNSTSVVTAITVFADNTIVQKQVTLPAHSRTSVLLCDIVNPLVKAYPNSAGYTVSADVQSFGGPIAVERPLYFVFSGDTGASDIFGYTGH